MSRTAGPEGIRVTPRRWLDALAWIGLAAATLATLWPLGLTNRVLAGLDALTYFTPYWDYRMAALRAGHLPLWNPYLFLGVPFLANIQAAVLYPLHWPLSWLPPERALIWSALFHVWLGAALTYTLGRRSLHLSRLAAFLAGMTFGLSGFTLARVENINQLNALAWLPGLLWLADETADAVGRVRLRWGVALTVVIALQLLAGHTQTAFVNFIAIGLYVLIPLVFTRRAAVWPRLSVLLAVLPALALTAAQLLPTLELMGLGWRTGGLPFRQAVSFSLRPRLLLQSLLPPFGGDLARAFGSEGYAEFVGYAAVTTLLLGGLGLFAVWRGRLPIRARALALAVLAVVGLFLALGAFNPAYYLLWRFVPGFDLFRAPVRWLALPAIGIAGLAGLGLDALQVMPLATKVIRPPSARGRFLLIAALLLLALLLVWQTWPRWPAILGWLAAGGLAIALILAARRTPMIARVLLVLLTFAELWLAARALPFTLATAPMALDLRNAPAALLAAEDGPPAGRSRFLSLSDIRYDPGDLTALRALQADRLPPESVERLVRAAKLMEVVAPNLSLLLQLPAADGYDGGLLPTDDYVNYQELFLSPDERLPDGRLREQLRQTPAARLLDLLGIEYVITDKQHDLWADDVYYDLEHAAVLQPGQALRLELQGRDAPFSATRVGLVSHLQGDTPPRQAVAEVIIETEQPPFFYLPVRSGRETDWAQATDPRARVARQWPNWMGAGRDYLAQLDLPSPATPVAITVRVPATAGGALTLRGLSLIDDRTGAHASVTVSQDGSLRRIHSGDVKLYRRLGAPGRAWLVHGITPAADRSAALRILTDPAFDPRAAVVLQGGFPARPPGAAGVGDSIKTTIQEPAKQVYRVTLGRLGALVLADAYYPGWQAVVDGYPAKVERANGMFRAILLDAGTHDVTLEYRPDGWQSGAAISLVSLGVLTALLLAGFVWPRGRRPVPVSIEVASTDAPDAAGKV